jgi:peptidoglycan hydrolase FlgJ
MIRPASNLDRQQAMPGMSAPVISPPNANESSFSDALAGLSADSSTKEEPLREAFQDFVGQTLFGQMLSSMRSTVGKPAYFHGGRGEEVFQEQLDALLVEEISEASASSVADPMFELFQMQRSQ